MKFRLRTQSQIFSRRGSADEMRKLERLGFRFVPNDDCLPGTSILDYGVDTPDVEINSLDELIDFIAEHGPILMDEETIEIRNDHG